MSDNIQQCKLSEALIYALVKIVEKNPNNYRNAYQNLISTLSPNLSHLNSNISDKLLEKYEKISNRFTDSFYDEVLGHNIVLQSGKFNREYSDDRQRLGGGNAGTVYKVKSKSDDKEYAIKEIETTAFNIAKEFGEVRNLAKLRNKNIVEYKATWLEFVRLNKPEQDSEQEQHEIQNDVILDVNEELKSINPKDFDINQYIQMELCQMTLSEATKKIRAEFGLTFNYKNSAVSYIATQLLLELIKGLDYLHTRTPPLIHQDLHSGNVLLSDGLNGFFIRISDFDPKDNSFDRLERKTSVKSNIEEIGIIFAKLLGFGTQTDRVKSQTQSGVSSQSQDATEEAKSISSEIPDTENAPKYIKMLSKLLHFKINKCSKIILTLRTWIVTKKDIMHEKSIIDIINSIANTEYNQIEKTSHKIIHKKFESEINKLYKYERLQQTVNKSGDVLGRAFANIKRCQKSSFTVKASDGLETESVKELIKYAFRVNYNYEEITEFISQHMSNNTEFNNNNTNKWFCFIWIHNSDSLIDWLKNDTYIVEFEDQSKTTFNKTKVLIFRERHYKTDAYCKNTFETSMNSENSMKSESDIIRDLSIIIIDECLKNINPPLKHIKDSIINSLKSKYPDMSFECYISINEYYLMMAKHDQKDKIMAFRHKNFCVLITTRFQSSVKEWPEITGLEKVNVEDRDVIERVLLDQICFIEDTTSIRSISSKNTEKRCLIFHNSKIDEKYPKGLYDNCYYLKNIKLNANQNNGINGNRNSTIASNSSDNKNYAIKYSIIDYSKYMKPIESHIKLLWFDKPIPIPNTPKKRKNTSITPTNKINNLLRSPAKKNKMTP